MTKIAKLLTAAALLGTAAAPASGQYYPQPQPYPAPHPYPAPGYPGQNYPYPNQGYEQPYTESTIGSIIDSLIGNRGYGVSDRQAIRQCAWAAVQRAQAQYSGAYPYQGYPQGYRGGGYNRSVRVTAITDVQRRSRGVRVRGMLSTGGGYGQRSYDPRYGYGGGYGGGGYGNLSFRCDVDYRGYVSDVRLGNGYRNY